MRERRSPKGQGFLWKEGPPTYAILSQNFFETIVAIYALSDMILWRFQQKSTFFEKLSMIGLKKIACDHSPLYPSWVGFPWLSTKR